MGQENKAGKFLTPDSFGHGTFIGNDPSIQDLNPEDRVTVSAHRHACPSKEAVIKYYGQVWLKTQNSPESISPEVVREHGIELTRQRYDECDFVFRFIVEQVANQGPKKIGLLTSLTTPTPRLRGENVGKYEEGSVPPSHETQMSPLSTLVGYALPRVFIEQAGREKERTWERYNLAIDLLNRAIEKSETPTELLANLAELTTQANGNATAILGHVLEPGILLEENNRSEYNQVAATLEKHAPKLWSHFTNKSEAEREQDGIIKQIPQP